MKAWAHKGSDTFSGIAPSFFPTTTTPSTIADNGTRGHTQSPIVTGTSVLGLKFQDGVMLAADNLASYGSMARFQDIERLIKVGKYTVVGVGGDISDFQYLQRLLDALTYDHEGILLMAAFENRTLMTNMNFDLSMYMSI